MTFRWEALPETKKGRGQIDWAAIAEALRARPQQWAMVAAYNKASTASTTASFIRTGRYASMKFGFEGKARTVDGEYRVYARYVGEDKA